MSNVIYSRGYPYGAPMIWIRGGGTKDPAVKTLLLERKFVWSSRMHGWEGVCLQPEVPEMLKKIAALGHEVKQKEGDKYPALHQENEDVAEQKQEI